MVKPVRDGGDGAWSPPGRRAAAAASASRLTASRAGRSRPHSPCATAGAHGGFAAGLAAPVSTPVPAPVYNLLLTYKYL
jgi:hypothetical protein